RGLAEQTARRHGDTLLELIREGAQCPSADCPTLPPRTRLEADQEALVDVAMGLLRHLALKNDISPAAIATRRDLEALVSGDPDCSLLQGWRARLAGRELSTWLRGETGLSVRGHQLTLTHGENPER
ncbi:ribonuclease D, partial [Ectothiorhodospira haloalkaliphila]